MIPKSEQELKNSLRLQHLKKMVAFSERRMAIRMESDFACFVREAWHVIEPSRPLKWNWHITMIVEYMEAVYRGEIKRLIINIPPRHMKSLLVSVFFPAWVWTTRPETQFLTLSHGDKLAIRDATKSRRLIESPWYQERWGSRFKFSGDQNEKKRYENSKNGHRIAQGITAGLTGDGGDIITLDDPHDAARAQSEADRETVLEAYDSKVSTRLNDPSTGAIILIMQRLHEVDLAGHLLSGEEDWEHLVLPARYEGPRFLSSLGFRDTRTENGALLWPDHMPEGTLSTLETRLGTYAAAGQLQQRPTPAGGGIIKRDWWRIWGYKPVPICKYVLLSWDTAFSEKEQERSSYSAMTCWGVFNDEETERDTMFMLAAWRGRVGYPELRRKAKEFYRDFEPDVVLIEKKASGQSLIQDLRSANIPVVPYLPDRDKVARAHAVSAMFESGQVYAPNYRWAEEVIHEVSMFPMGANDDFVDTVTQACLYVRNLFLVTHPEDPDFDSQMGERNVTQTGHIYDG